MHTKRILEVPLPDGVRLDGDDVELLKAAFQALVSLRAEKDRRWELTRKQLEDDGWSVRWGLTWRAEVKRGEDYEEATGPTLDEALAGVAQLARVDMVGHVP